LIETRHGDIFVVRGGAGSTVNGLWTPTFNAMLSHDAYAALAQLPDALTYMVSLPMQT